MPICGGNWNNEAKAGVFAVNLNNPRSNVNWNIGFRSALPSQSDVAGLRACFQNRGDKGFCFLCLGKKMDGHGMPKVT